MQAYCMKCRAKKEMKDAKSITMKNGRPATRIWRSWDCSTPEILDSDHEMVDFGQFGGLTTHIRGNNIFTIRCQALS